MFAPALSRGFFYRLARLVWYFSTLPSPDHMPMNQHLNARHHLAEMSSSRQLLVLPIMILCVRFSLIHHRLILLSDKKGGFQAETSD
jgi:hypothetical protein